MKEEGENPPCPSMTTLTWTPGPGDVDAAREQVASFAARDEYETFCYALGVTQGQEIYMIDDSNPPRVQALLTQWLLCERVIPEEELFAALTRTFEKECDCKEKGLRRFDSYKLTFARE